MRQLEIAYQLDGKQRGYQFVSSTAGFNDDTLKAVWRSAMPKGQGWGADIYQDARTLKTFALADGRFALSEVTVTGQRDESGRAGIRHARVDVMQPGEYGEALCNHLDTYPTSVLEDIQRRTGLFGQSRIPSVQGNEQIVLTRPYQRDQWAIVEAIVLLAAHQVFARRWRGSRFISFTTLALDWRGKSQMVVLPTNRAAGAKCETI